MNALNLLKPAFDWVLQATWSASILIGLVLLLQWVLRDRLAARWRYALWLLVVVRLALPVSPGSAVSLFNFAKLEATKRARVESSALAATPSASVTSAEPAGSVPGQMRRPRWFMEATDEETELRLSVAGSTRTLKTPEVIYWIAFALWAPVCAYLILRWLWQNGRFLRQIQTCERVAQADVLQLFEECRSLSKVTSQVALLRVEEIRSPALYGVFQPRLLLPGDLITNFKREELWHIFLHELAHVKRWDTAVNGVAALLQMLHWFNPLVRLAFRRMALDRELACDEMALNCLKAGQNQAYGETILKLLKTAPQRLPTFTTVGILEDYRQLLTRMRGIARYGSRQTRPILALGLLISLAVVGLSDAQNTPGTKIDVASVPRESVTRTLHLTGSEADSVLSPDESKIVFSDWGKSGADLVLKDLRTQESRRLTQVGTNWFIAETTVWSPDSKRIAYTWYQDDADEIRIASADGRDNKLILAVPWKENYYPYLTDWSRDGNYLLCERHSKGTVLALARIQIDSGETKVIVSNLDVKLRGSTGRGTHARFSPDGEYVVFQQALNGHRDIYVVRVTDGEVWRVINWPSEDANPVWSPDGKHVLFGSDRRGQWELWALPVETGKPAGEPILVRSAFGDYSTEINARGKLVHYSNQPFMVDYFITVNPESGEIGPPRLIYADPSDPRLRAAWVPEDRYCYWRKTTLYVVSLDGKEEVIPTDLRMVETFRVSYDGKWICIQGRNAKDQAGVFVINLERRNLETLLLTDEYKIAGGASLTAEAFTADSKEVVVHRTNEYAAVHVESKKLRRQKSPEKPLRRLQADGWIAVEKTVYVEEDTEKKEDRLTVFDHATGETKVVLRAAHPERIQTPTWRRQRLERDQSPQVIYRRITADGGKELRLFALDSSMHRTIPVANLDFDQRRKPNISWDGSIMAIALQSKEMLFLAMDGKWQRKVILKGEPASSGVWFADNRTLLFPARNEPRLEIGIIENYLAGRGQ